MYGCMNMERSEMNAMPMWQQHLFKRHFATCLQINLIDQSEQFGEITE